MFRFGGGRVIFKGLHLMLYFHIKLFISKALHKQCLCSVISGLGKYSQTAFIVISNHMLQINWKSWTNLLHKTKSQSCMCQCMYMCVYSYMGVSVRFLLNEFRNFNWLTFSKSHSSGQSRHKGQGLLQHHGL